ncbi:MAG TPA: Rid family hydrolase [Pseudolysinimonas sp.]|nr:Rid family hydrolase [Pseudolysinimonas sp.]
MSEWISEREPVPPHAFAHWVSNGELIIVSGTVGFNPADFSVPESAGEQAELAIANLEYALKQAGSGLHELVWVKPTLVNADDIPAVDEVFNRLLPNPRPAGGALTVVSALAAPSFKVELDAWASKGANVKARTSAG